jgi:hypothetical protein
MRLFDEFQFSGGGASDVPPLAEDDGSPIAGDPFVRDGFNRAKPLFTLRASYLLVL